MLNSSELLPSKPQAKLQLWILTGADSFLKFLQQFADMNSEKYQLWGFMI